MHGRQKLIRAIKAILLGTLCVALYILVSQNTDIIGSDTAARILNGKLLFQTLNITLANTFSYTQQYVNYIDTNAFSDMSFYILHKFFGTSAVYVFYAQLKIVSLLVFFLIAQRYGNFLSALLAATIALPLITFKTSPCPDAFAAIFAGIFLFTLGAKLKKPKTLYLLAIIQLCWSFTDGSYFIGPVIYGLFILKTVLTKKPALPLCNAPTNNEESLPGKTVLYSGILVFMAALINPATYNLFAKVTNAIAIAPTVDNLSVFSLAYIATDISALSFFNVSSILLLAACIVALIFWRKKTPFEILTPAFIALILVLFKVKYFALFGFLFIPAGTWFFKIIWQKIESINPKTNKAIISFLFALLILLPGAKETAQSVIQNINTKKTQNQQDVIIFLKQTEIKSPVFNNFDSGGFLALTLPRNEKVYIDAREGAYTKEFIDRYINVLQNDENWNEEKDKYNFRTIFFSNLTLTTTAMSFLERRVKDGNWKVVFSNDYAAILEKIE